MMELFQFPFYAIFAKSRIRSVMSLRLSAFMEQLGSHWTDFHEISYLNILRKTVKQIQVLFKYDKINGYFP